MNFLKGSYGIDYLTIFLLILGSILNLFRVSYILGLLISIYAIYRIFSKNIRKRESENYFFISKANIFLRRFGKSIPTNSRPFSFYNLSTLFFTLSKYISEKKDFKITKCPQCGQKLRLPRRKGKIVVTCKRCSSKFDFKT